MNNQADQFTRIKEVFLLFPWMGFTAFGAPNALFPDDWDPIEDKKMEQSKVILNSCWIALDQAISAAQGKEL